MTMTKQEAIALLERLVGIEVRITNEINGKHSGITKKSLREERRAVGAIFEALTGEKPTAADITAIVE